MKRRKRTLTKKEVIRVFGGTQTAVAKALDISVQAVHQWPDRLSQGLTDRVMGAAARLGKYNELV